MGRLAELKLSLDASNLGGAGVAKAQDVLRTQDVLVVGFKASKTTDDLNAALAKSSLSLKEFSRLVD